MKKFLSIVAILSILGLFALAYCGAGCSQDELAAFGQEHPKLAPATQAVGKIETAADPAAAEAKKLADDGAAGAKAAEAVGIPYAGGVYGVLSGVSLLIGTYIERRRGKPVKTALTQVVQSVETAFPTKTPDQKAALANVQDQATKAIVTQIKGT